MEKPYGVFRVLRNDFRDGMGIEGYVGGLMIIHRTREDNFKGTEVAPKLLRHTLLSKYSFEYNKNAKYRLHLIFTGALSDWAKT